MAQKKLSIFVLWLLALTTIVLSAPSRNPDTFRKPTAPQRPQLNPAQPGHFSAWRENISNGNSLLEKPLTNCTSTLDAPCQCHEPLFDVYNVICSGQVNQNDIDQFFSYLRLANEMSTDEILYIPRVIIEKTTTLTELNMAGFFNTRIGSLQLSWNTGLLGFTGANEIIEGGHTIEIYETWIQQCNFLRHERYRDLFRVSPGMINLFLSERSAEIGSYDIGDGSGDIEFLPGVSALTKLENLQLTYLMEPQTYRGGQFKRHGNLRDISIHTGYGEANIFQKDAFLLDEPSEDYTGVVVHIDLDYARLSDENFDSTEGPVFPAMNGKNRQVQIQLESNYLEFLNEAHFKTFLDSNPENTINGRYNLYYCDQRMAWLKHGKEFYEERVKYIRCNNDPEGLDVFTTSLIT